MSSSTNCTLFAPQTRLCGEFGECFELSPDPADVFCVCAEGYTQFGDFSIAAANPCDINITAIRVLWAIALASALGAITSSIWGILSRRQAKIAQWQAWRLWLVPYLVIVQSALAAVMCVGKIAEPTVWNLGQHIPMTVIHGMQALLSVTFLVVALAGVARTAYTDTIRGKSPEERMSMKIKMRKLESFIAAFWFLAAASAFVPAASIVDPTNVFWAAGIHGGVFAAMMLILGSIVAPFEFATVISRIEQSMRSNLSRAGTSHKKMEKVLLKLRVAKRVAIYGFPTAAGFVFICTVWPFLVVKVAYMLPILETLIEACGAALIWVTTTTNSLQLRRASSGFARLSQALSSATPGMALRRSLDRRTSKEKRVSVETAMLVSPGNAVETESS